MSTLINIIAYIVRVALLAVVLVLRSVPSHNNKHQNNNNTNNAPSVATVDAFRSLPSSAVVSHRKTKPTNTYNWNSNTNNLLFVGNTHHHHHYNPKKKKKKMVDDDTTTSATTRTNTNSTSTNQKKTKNVRTMTPLPPHHARGIIFDIDGTLADSWKLGYEATNVVLQRNNISPISAEIYHSHTRYATPERLARHAGLRPPTDTETNMTTVTNTNTNTDSNFYRTGQQLGQQFDDLYVDLVTTETAGYYAGITELLTLLQTTQRRDSNSSSSSSTVKLGALTNACVAYAHAVLQINDATIQNANNTESTTSLYQSFVTIHGADTVAEPKPSPAGLLQCCHELHLRPHEECLYIGDSPSDALVRTGQRRCL